MLLRCGARTAAAASCSAARSGGARARARAAGGGGGCAAARSLGSMPGMVVFNRDHKLRQRNRAAARPDYDRFTYIRDHLAAQVVDRLQDILRDFPVAVDVGCGAGHILKHLPGAVAPGKVGRLIQVDSSLGMLRRSLEHKQAAADTGIASHVVHADEEFLPFADNSVDLVVSCMSMHWINDLPGTLIQINRMLKPNGVFLGVMLGGESLHELRSSFVLAEQERSGGISQHTSPVAQVGDVGALLLNAGFKIPTIDTDIFHINYDDAAQVMEHLQGMGDSNACVGRLGYAGQDVLLATAAVYQHAYGSEWAADYDQAHATASASEAELEAAAALDYPEEEDDPEFLDDGIADAMDGGGGDAIDLQADATAATEPQGPREGERGKQQQEQEEEGEDGGGGGGGDDADVVAEIPCTFQSIHMIGWKHHESQPTPLARGSAGRSFKEIGSVSSDDFA